MMKIYVANLGKYNEGELVGAWLNLPCTEEQMLDLFVKIGVGQYDEDGIYAHGVEMDGIFYEEYAIHDYETDIAGLKIGEYENIEELSNMAESIEGKEEEFSAIVEAYGSHNITHCLEILENENYTFYENFTMNDLAEHIVEECYAFEMSEFALQYFDYDAFARDLSMDYTDVSNGIIQLH